MEKSWGPLCLMSLILSAGLPACDRDPDADPVQRAQRKATCPDLETWADCAARGAAQAKLAAEKKEAAQKASDAAAETAVAKQSAAMTAAKREAWLRQCTRNATCKQWQVDAILEGAPQPERAHATLVAFAARAQQIAMTAEDGTTINEVPAGLVAGLVGRFGLALLGEMPPTTLRDAKKDPEGSRGKVTSVTGNVIEIRKSGELFEGALATDDLTIVRFVTMMSTAGIYGEKRAVFRGIFLQEFDYDNVSGGQTRALLYVVAGNRRPGGRSAARGSRRHRSRHGSQSLRWNNLAPCSSPRLRARPAMACCTILMPSRAAIEKIVLDALAGQLPTPEIPTPPAEKSEFPKPLALDCNQWVFLGRAHYGRSPPSGAADALDAIRKARPRFPRDGQEHLTSASFHDVEAKILVTLGD